MNQYGIQFEVKNKPSLDPEFMPILKFNRAFLETAKKPVSIALERSGGQVAVYRTRVHGTEELREADVYYIDRIIKTLLWMKGGFRVYLAGNEAVCAAMAEHYSAHGSRAFDFDYMANVYEHPFEVVRVDAVPEEKSVSKAIGRHLDGCRIGFDAGGSDRKVSAVIDGETVYSEEVVWHPKTQTDPEYHYQGILDAFRTAASKMPRVDGIGVSSAGVFIGNAPMVSSLFIKVPRDRRGPIRTIYDRAAAAIGDVPIVVANDGDVTALAGAMSLHDSRVMGLAMGTSEAVGYVNREGCILGWFNELAFAPVDLNEQAARDEWSGDIGVGCKYFSQDAVIKLAPAAGIALDAAMTPAEKLKAVQQLAERGDAQALAIFRDIGVYLGHTLPLYASIYDLKHLLVLGRVASGAGGEVIVAECRRVLAEEYPALAVSVTLPDEAFRRVGQSMAAASLPTASLPEV